MLREYGVEFDTTAPPLDHFCTDTDYAYDKEFTSLLSYALACVIKLSIAGCLCQLSVCIKICLLIVSPSDYNSVDHILLICLLLHTCSAAYKMTKESS